MKIFNNVLLRELDAYTIEHEPIHSIDLMERAASAMTKEIIQRWNISTHIFVFAGPGNNGGDALAVARILIEKGYHVTSYLFNVKGKLSPDCKTNYDRLMNLCDVEDLIEVKDEFDPPLISEQDLIVDGLFGSGLGRPLDGGFASLVRYINSVRAQIVSLDMPSGVKVDGNEDGIGDNVIHANITLGVQLPKLSFMFADHQTAFGDIHLLDIGLSKEWIECTPSRFSIIEEKDICSFLRQRSSFSNKGDMGHALLVAGSIGMSGAAVLASKACLRCGAGKVTVHTPSCNTTILQISVPEAIVSVDVDANNVTQIENISRFDAIGIGPGLGKCTPTLVALLKLLKDSRVSIVIDADAINMLGARKDCFSQLPKGTIFTPHPKEYDRLDSASLSDCERLTKASCFAVEHEAYVILKGHRTALCLPNGNIVFNSSGNAGMATAGSGDVLTGMIVALLARGYEHSEACMLGMYLHGLAGDIAVASIGQESLIASDIINHIPNAFMKLEEHLL